MFFKISINSAYLHLDPRYAPAVAFSQLASCLFWSLHLFWRLPSSSSLKPSQGLLIDAFTLLQVIRNAKLWCDVESAKEAATLSEQWDYNLVPGFTASKILWLKQNEPENFDRLAKVLLPHDYFNWYLTGRYVAEVRLGISEQYNLT